MSDSKPSSTRLPLYVLAMTLCCVPSSASDATSRTVHCGTIDQMYLYHLPGQSKQAASDQNDNHLPLVMLLHGAGDHAANMVNAWEHLADKKEENRFAGAGIAAGSKV